MSLTDKINEYARQEFGTTEPTSGVTNGEQTPVAEMAQGAVEPEAQPVADTAETTTTAATETQTQPIIPAAATTSQAPDYNTILDEMSGGVFKSVDDFKAALPKIGEYDSLATQKAELEAKLQADPFANDYVKKLNDFVKSGASQDQINNFQRVNQIGDPTQLSPIEAKVTKMVMVDGYSEAIARQIVETDFPISEYEDGSTEKLILEEKLRVSAANDAKELTKFIADATKVDTTAQQAQETQRLEAIAQEAQYTNHVKTLAPQIAQTITGLGEISLIEKEGEESIKFNVEYPNEFRNTIPEKISNYFLETGSEVNADNITEAQRYIAANYLAENFTTIAKNIANQVEAKIWEKAVNKYENRSGLPPAQEPVGVENQQKELSDFMNRVAGVGKR